MSQSPNNPYAPRGAAPGPAGGPPPRGPTGYEAWDMPASREPTMSVMAVLSLVFAVLCITSPLGVVFGIAALVLIAGSGGRKYGKGLAITGIVLGLVFSTLVIGSVIGARSLFGVYESQMVKPLGDTIAAIDAQDRDASRTILTGEAGAEATDAVLDRFRDEFRQEVGAFKSVPTGLDIFTAMQEVAQAMNQAQQAMSANSPGQVNVRGVPTAPTPIRFENGTAVIMGFAPESLRGVIPGSPGTLKNLVLITNNGRLIWLFEPDGQPATKPLGLPAGVPATPTAPAEAPPQPAPGTGG